MKIVKVRKVNIGCGIPKIAVPLVGATNEELLNEAEYLKNLDFDIVEWRVDFYEKVEDINEVKNILLDLRKIVNDIPILFTFRTKDEGGNKFISKEDYLKLNTEIILSGDIDLVDLELFTGEKQVKELIKTAHNNNVKAVVSNHDFNKTPSKEEIISRIKKMINLGADIPKIAVMPNSTDDVLTLLSATNVIKNDFKDIPIITMSMGKLGMISRVSGEFFGSCLTFGAAKKASAPGQIDIESLNMILNIFHKTQE